MEEIHGIVEEIIFCNETNGYTVLEIRHGKKKTTLVGVMPGVNIGETLIAKGMWMNHPDYGRQLKVEVFEKKLPSLLEDIEKYLGSGIIKGVGPATAKKIVDKFKGKTFVVLQNNPDKLTAIKGITTVKALSIGLAFNKQQEMKNVVMFLQHYGISATYAVKVYKKFGSSSIDEIKKNPYRLTEEEIGIGFKTADGIAHALGIDLSSKFRLQCGIKYVLGKAVAQGHTYLPKESLVTYTSNILNINEESILDAIVLMQLEETVYVDDNRVYLMPFYMSEVGIANKLKRLMSTEESFSEEEFKEKLLSIEKCFDINYATEQREAIKNACINAVSVITGGPGTGKTTIIKGIIKTFVDKGLEVILAAPTGRAAKRMSEATGYEAKTIHRLLEIGYTSDSQAQYFLRDDNFPIEADVIIIDEMSMVDILLMNSLLKAIRLGTRLILVGDADQLPSVGAGRVLMDILSSECIPSTFLKNIFRQSSESMIVVNAHKINNGEEPIINAEGKDFFFISKQSGDDISRMVVELCASIIPQKFGISFGKDIQVLSPSKKGAAGVNALNSKLQERLNPSSSDKREKHYRETIYRVGDRVMQVKNNYRLKWSVLKDNSCGEGVFNGDMGKIIDIDNRSQTLTVEFDDDKIVDYDYEALDELEQAYAVTVHKSQGSEFPVIIIPMYSYAPMLINRNLLYTAVTRAKRLVILVGIKEILNKMVENKKEAERYSGLEYMLKRKFAGDMEI